MSFLGFGIQPPDVSLGTLIANGTQSATTFPWVFLFPAGVLVLILVCANLTGDGLRDALDPGSGDAARWRPMSPLLEVTDLAVTFPTDGQPVTAVRGISYRVDPGEVVAMVGESGSGKSAVGDGGGGPAAGVRARCAARCGCTAPSCWGSADDAMSRFRGKAIGMVFQDPMSALTPVYTVGDQIAEAIEVHQPRVGKKAARRRAVELLELVGISQPERRARAFPHELSGGERQRVVIAIAIANDPDLLICDEPTTALDVTVQAQILEVLKTARDVTGAGVLIITHDLGVVAEFADRALVMYAGRVVEFAPGWTTFTATARCPTPWGCWVRFPGWTPRRAPGWCPYPARRRRWPASNRAARSRRAARWSSTNAALTNRNCSRSASTHRAACIRTDQVDGRTAADIYGVNTDRRGDSAGDSPVVVRVRDLVKTYRLTKGVVLRRTVGEVRAVDGVSFELRQGRTLGIVGESGSGKSTTLHEILELVAPQSGSIEVLGTDVATLSPARRRALRRDIQVVFQDPVASLDPRLPGLRADRRTVAGQRLRQERHQRAGRRAARHRRVAPRRRHPLPRRVLRRAEAAHRHRAGAGTAAQDPGARRTGVRPGRVHPGRASSTCCSTCKSGSACRISLCPMTFRWSSTSPTRWR